MKTGDVIACRGTRLISRLIMGFTQSKYSHVSVAINIQGNDYVVEMQRTGCDLISFENWIKKYNYSYEVYRPEKSVSAKRILSKASSTKYDLRSLFLRQPIKIIKERITGKKSKLIKVKNEESKMTCSEYVAWLYSIEDYYDMTPDDIVKECIKKDFNLISPTL
jgi:hypothetical protein